MINLGDEDGLGMIAYLRSTSFLDNNRPIDVYTRHPQTGQLRRTRIGEESGDPYNVFYDHERLHYWGLQGPLEIPSQRVFDSQVSSPLSELPPTPPAYEVSSSESDSNNQSDSDVWREDEPRRRSRNRKRPALRTLNDKDKGPASKAEPSRPYTLEQIAEAYIEAGNHRDLDLSYRKAIAQQPFTDKEHEVIKEHFSIAVKKGKLSDRNKLRLLKIVHKQGVKGKVKSAEYNKTPEAKQARRRFGRTEEAKKKARER